MADCEVCGSPLYGAGQLVEIEGAIVTVCKNCSRLGRPLKAAGKIATKPARPTGPPRKLPAAKPQVAYLVELDVKPDYARLVKGARERLNLTQEELGQRAGERTSVISLIERGKLKPSIPIVRKLEHVLKLELLVPVEEMSE